MCGLRSKTGRARVTAAPEIFEVDDPIVSQTCSIVVNVVNRLGLHARPAMSFVDVAMTFKSSIQVRKGETEVDGKSIMQMMMLAAGQGSELTITACGEDAPKACEALRDLVNSGFDEE